ncbi:MAG TPA: hypothetical protein PKZ64_01215 [Spirochaetota bacterium]|nr:hypothetical protein [Spirochaetota bacterium]HPJ43358.1 hypothetical protein [Spirochaetota bacterium]HPR37511.1 hypothetical protein [Spirochaetota bacterium]
MKKVFLSALIMLSFSCLYADQAAWITKDQAERGAALIRSSGKIRHFCAPCGDNFFRSENVHTVRAEKAAGSTPGDRYYEVLVNGNGVDLAYIYVLTGGVWINAAMSLNIPVESVPRILPSDLQDDQLLPENLPSEENIEDYDGSADYPLEEGE